MVALTLLGIGLALVAGISPALAIPSPELVVGSLSSISQIVALLTAIIGGGAAVVGVRARSRGENVSGAFRLATPITLGLAVLLVAAVGFNIYQFVGNRAAQLARLQDTLLRQATTPGGPKLDPTNLELSYSEMVKQPTGISTEEAAKLLDAVAGGKHDDVIFLDVRETAERDMGEIPGATFIRFPDFAAAKLDLKEKKPVLFCHNGNRSWETCMALKAQGIDCKFVIGGIEKWVVEKRPLTGLKDRTLDELRAIPEYRNHEVLLDTPDVRRLVKNEGAIFVDIRYPAEFAAGHIPDAINLTIRTTPTAELPAKIAAIPRRPIIIPCYDRRGCFFSEVMGLELTRAGYDFRGRYTLPWEYFVPRGRPPHVEKWLEEINQSWWTKSSRYLANLLSSIADRTGLLAAILMLALASRLVVLPFSLKAERDQIRSRESSAELEAMKARLKHDPRRFARAMHAFYRRHGLTPIRNLLALLFLPVMALAVAAVQLTATKKLSSFLWLGDLAERDQTFVLPALFAALIALYLDLAFARKRTHHLLIWLIAFPLLVGTGALLSAAADIYMIASAILLLVQRAAVTGEFRRLREIWRRLGHDNGVVSLANVDRLAGCGNKAIRLAQLHSQGFTVPEGLVLTPHFLAAFRVGTAAWRRRQLTRLWQRLGTERIAVRSSAAAEDGSAHSFAGVFDTVLNVDRTGLEAAITKVMASFDAPHVGNYCAERGDGSIILQRMIEAKYSGVLFTQHPSAGGLALVEMVDGTAEDLVSGTVAPDAYSFGRLSGRLIGKARPPIDLTDLIVTGRQAEKLFGAPQDIEWTYRDGRFHLVQSRDITRLLHDNNRSNALEGERARILDLAARASPEEIVFAQNEISEQLPRPTPLSLSLMNSFWESGGSVDLACRSLGLAYAIEEDSPDYLVTVFGRLYANKRDERSRALYIGPLTLQRLSRNADRIECEFREQFLPNFLREISVLEAVDFDRLSTGDLLAALDRVRRNFVGNTHVEVDVINIAANFYLEQAKKKLAKRGLEPAEYLAHIPETVPALALADAAQRRGEKRRNALLASFHHRAMFDYELAEPRYAEAPKSLAALCELPAAALSQTYNGVAKISAIETMNRSLRNAILMARRFQTLKEDAKHYALLELAVLRRVVLAVDRRFDLDGLAFHLNFDELASLHERSTSELKEVARQRRETSELFHEVPPLPPALTISKLETVSLNVAENAEAGDGIIRGTRVSGSGVVEGRARVVTAMEEERGMPIDDFRDGDIIVSPMVHPAWLPYFRRAGGLVCEVGGWLSHSAILARECDVPMIVGTQGLNTIMDGSRLRLHPDGTVEILSRTNLQVFPAEAAE